MNQNVRTLTTSQHVRTFHASSMPEALALVKRELGRDALLIETRTLPAGVEIIAGPATPSDPIPEPRPAGSDRAMLPEPRPAGSDRAALSKLRPPTVDSPRAPTPRDRLPATAAAADAPIPEHLYPFYVQLVQNEVAESLARDWVHEAGQSAAPGENPEHALRRVVQAHLVRLAPPIPDADDKRTAGRRKIALVGPPGSGKTTTLAKLAAHHHARDRHSVAVLSLDSSRLGAVEQLRVYARVLDIPLYTAQSLAEVKTVLDQTGTVARLLIDTPGIGLRDQGRFARVAALLRAIRPDEVHLVLPVSLVPQAQQRLADSFRALGTSRLILTRLDEAVGFGALINTAQRLQLGISYVTNGQSIPQDLAPAGESHLADLLLSGT